MPELDDPISERELDVLICLAEGASNREIAQKLSISPNTVKVHVRNIFTKLGVSSRTEATTVALQKGVLSIPGIGVEADEEDDTVDEEHGIEGVTSSLEPGAEPRQEQSLEAGSGSRFPVTDASPPDNAGSVSQSFLKRLLFVATVIAIAFLFVTGLNMGSLLNQPDAQGAVITESTATVDPTATAEPFQETEIGEKWFLSRALPEARADMVVATVGLNLYVIGGETKAGVDNSVFVYETQRHEWSARSPKLTAVADASGDILAGEIYVVGGRSETGSATTVVEAYSPLNDAWRLVTPLPQAVAGGLVLTNGGLLYLIGGYNSTGVLDTVFVYNPTTGEWEERPPLKQARAHAVGGVLGGKLYVVGGSDGENALASCEQFDPLRLTWTACPDMHHARMDAGAAVFLNKLYVMGGLADSKVRSSEVYDATTDSWVEFETPMLEEVPNWANFGVSSVETHIYALGGRHDGNLNAEMYVYRPLAYQFFIPAAPSGD